MTGIEGAKLGSRKPLLKRASLVVPLTFAPATLNRTSWPAGFAPGRTPIVTYVRHDFELSRDELIEYLPTVGLDSVANSFRRRRGEPDHHVDPPSSTYLGPFGDPHNRYASLVSTTGLHWGKVLSDGKQKAYATLRADLERWAQKAIELGRPGKVRSSHYLTLCELPLQALLAGETSTCGTDPVSASTCERRPRTNARARPTPSSPAPRLSRPSRWTGFCRSIGSFRCARAPPF